LRTRQTANPVATMRGLTPIVVPIDGESPRAHVEAVAVVVRRHGGTVLIVGHSNTVSAIIRAFGGLEVPAISEESYSNLFVLVAGTADMRLVRARYGPADPRAGGPPK